MMKEKLKKYKLLLIIALVIIIFPFVVGFIYKLPLPQIIPIEMGDLIGFYATAFAIPGSFAVLYVTRKMEEEDRNREKKEQNDREIEERKPHFVITLKKANSCFNLTVNKCGNGKYKDICFYDTRICDIWTKNCYKYKLRFNVNTTEKSRVRIINILDTFSDLDNNGYPEEFTIFCEDIKIGAMFYIVYYK